MFKIFDDIYKNLFKLELYYNCYFRNFLINNLIVFDFDVFYKFINLKVDDYVGNFEYIKNIVNFLFVINN